MKKIMLIVAMVVAGSCAFAQSDLLTADYSGAGWYRSYQDQSDYPDADSRHGTIVRYFDAEKYPVAAGGSVYLDGFRKGRNNEQIKDNVIIWDGYIQVLEGLQGSGTPSVGIRCNTTNDILAVGTTLNSTGLKAIVPVGTVAAAVTSTNDTELILDVNSASSITNGFFMLVLDVYYGQ